MLWSSLRCSKKHNGTTPAARVLSIQRRGYLLRNRIKAKFTHAKKGNINGKLTLGRDCVRGGEREVWRPAIR
jgi:hypothetical protein